MNQEHKLTSISPTQTFHPARPEGRPPTAENPEPDDKPNPCAPPLKEPGCHCPKPPGVREAPRKPRRPRRRKDSCCEQLIQLISGLPGLDLPKLHKPKQSPARKVRAMCDALGVADAIIPALSVLWKRQKGGEKGRNLFEQQVQHIFSTLESKESEGLDAAMKGYEELRKGGKGECLFNDCLADAAKVGPLEKSWFTAEILREGFKVAGQVVFKNSDGVMGPGQVRLWDNKRVSGPNGSGATVFQGPWPWLTAIAPDHSSYEEYGNLESFRPVPGGFHQWQEYQYAKNCTFTTDQTGKIFANCEREHPPVPPAGQFQSSKGCEGGPHYTHGNDCICIPAQRPGGSLKLRGFNLITPTVKVRFSRVGDPSVSVEVECVVWGDQVVPAKDASNHFITDESVFDWVDFPIPDRHPVTPGAPLSAGLYEITLLVANVTNAIYDSSVPPVLFSNTLLVRIEPDPNVKFRLWCDDGWCNEETDGIGDDEIWWDAFVGQIVPNKEPVGGQELKNVERKSFPRDAWEDMNSHEGAGTFTRDIFGPASFELYGVAAFAIVGFEVDSESAARDQLEGFWNAWAHALGEVVGLSLTASGTATGIAGLAVKAGIVAANVALTAALIALAIVAVVTLLATALWAAWAPADLIAMDIFHLDALKAWDRTDPAKPLPPETERKFEDAHDEDNLITVTESPRPKEPKPGDASAVYEQVHTYVTPEDGEDSSYGLRFKLARS